VGLTDREKLLLRRALQMANREGGWEYPADVTEEELNQLWKDLDGEFYIFKVDGISYEDWLSE
jgi:hypothetical protein